MVTFVAFAPQIPSGENSASLPQRCPLLRVGTGSAPAFCRELAPYTSTRKLDGFYTHFDGSPLFRGAHVSPEARLARPDNHLNVQPPAPSNAFASHRLSDHRPKVHSQRLIQAESPSLLALIILLVCETSWGLGDNIKTKKS